MKASKDFDTIDIIVSKVFDMEPGMLRSPARIGRIALARFMAMSIRKESGLELADVAMIYSKSLGAVRHALVQVENLLKYDRKFRQKYELAKYYLNEKRMPYSPDLIHEGAKVWTRPDSAGNDLQGYVTSVSQTSFTVESFENPGFITHNRLEDGRLSSNCESSLDIISVHP